jgi:hypothetical protein
MLLPVSLPALEELIMYGVDHILIPSHASIQFPALKDLSLTCYPTFIPVVMRRLTPSFVNVRISALIEHVDDCSATANSGFPSHLQRIFIHAPTKPECMVSLGSYISIMHSLRLLADSDNRLSLSTRS